MNMCIFNHVHIIIVASVKPTYILAPMFKGRPKSVGFRAGPKGTKDPKLP